jgi:hypothetical protein
MVAGNSFITSTNTSSAAAAAGRRSRGQCTRVSKEKPPVPSMRAESSKLAGMRA